MFLYSNGFVFRYNVCIDASPPVKSSGQNGIAAVQSVDNPLDLTILLAISVFHLAP
jgi:hypothetical protein